MDAGPYQSIASGQTRRDSLSVPLRLRERTPSPATARTLLRKEATRAVLIIVGSKLGVAAVFALACLFMPFSLRSRANNALTFPAQDPDQVNLTSHFITFDSSHYLYLAEHGYAPDQISNAFAPMYPLSVRSLDKLVGNVIISGLLISNVASGVGLFLFFWFVRRHFGPKAAMRSLLLMVAFPTAFFLSIVYSEGLFFFFAMLFFTGLYERKFALAAFAAFFLPLTRFVGVLAFVPFAALYIGDAMKKTDVSLFRSNPRAYSRRRLLRVFLFVRPQALWLLSPLLGALVYFWYMKVTAGDAFAAQHAASQFIPGWNVRNVVDPLHLLRVTFGETLVLHSGTNSVIDRAFFLAFLLFLPVVYRLVDRPLFFWCLLMGLTPLLGSYMAYMRYVLMAFPIFIASGVALADESNRRLRIALYPCIVFQVLFLSFHVADYWIA